MDSPLEKRDSTREEEFLEGVAVKSSFPGIVPANINVSIPSLQAT
jgi:hypothetical protein